MRNIAIICGGDSGEFEISVGSGKMVSDHLSREKFNPFLVILNTEGWYYKDEQGKKTEIDRSDFGLTLDGTRIKFDGVFNAIHGTPGEDGKLAGYFDMIGMPYTSCGQACSALTFNKHLCNRFVSSYGINTARSLSFSKKEKPGIQFIADTLGMPVFVKPAESGSSVGISKVNEVDGLEPAIEQAFLESERILIEEFIDGREIACGVFEDKNQLIVLPLTEIISKKEFFDYEAKYTAGMAEEITPAVVENEAEQDIKSVSGFLYREMDCKGFVRFDYLLTPSDLYFLEVNTIPGMTTASIIPQMVRAFGMDVGEFFDTITENMFL